MGRYSQHRAHLVIDDIVDMVHDHARECVEFDFKSMFDMEKVSKTHPGRDARVEFMCDLISFANVKGGGSLIYGVDAISGFPNCAGKWTPFSQADAEGIVQTIKGLHERWIVPLITMMKVHPERIPRTEFYIVVVDIPYDGELHGVEQNDKPTLFYKRVEDHSIRMEGYEISNWNKTARPADGPDAVSAHSYVYSYLVDLMPSVAQSDTRTDVAVDRFQESFQTYLDGLREHLPLSDVRVEFPGDSVRVVTKNGDDLFGLCYLGVIASRNFREYLARRLPIPVECVPPLRTSICSGKGKKVGRNIVSRDSNNRADEAHGHCLENEVLVDGGVEDFVRGPFDFERRPSDPKPEQVGGNRPLFTLKGLCQGYLPDLELMAAHQFALRETGTEDELPERATELEDRLEQETQCLSDEPSEARRRVARQWDGILSSQPDYGEAQRVYLRMQSNGIKPDIYVFSMLMDKSPNYREARKWLSEMQGVGIEPNIYSYTTLIHKALEHESAVPCTNDMLERARDCYDEMLGHGIEPNARTYGPLVLWSPDYQTARAWMDEADHHGIEPTQFLYSALLRQAPDQVTAEPVLDEMKEHGIDMTVLDYTHMIHTSKNYRQAEDWYTSMRRSHIEPNVFVLNNLLEKAPSFTRAKECLTKLTGEHVVPDIVTYNTMIKKSPNSDFQTASDLYQTLRASGLHPTEHTLLALVHHSPGLDEALKWVDELLGEGITVDTKVTQQLLRFTSTPESVVRVRSKVKALGLRFDTPCFNVILSKARDLEAARRVVDEIRTSGLRPDEDTYKALMSLATGWEDAELMFKQMAADKVSLTSEIGSALISTAGDYRQGLDYLDRLKNKGMATTDIVWMALVRLDLSGVTAEELLATYVSGPVRCRRVVELAISNYQRQARWIDCFFLAMNYAFLNISLRIMKDRHESAAYFRTFLDDPKQRNNAECALGMALHQIQQDTEALVYLKRAWEGNPPNARRDLLGKVIDGIALKETNETSGMAL